MAAVRDGHIFSGGELEVNLFPLRSKLRIPALRVPRIAILAAALIWIACVAGFDLAGTTLDDKRVQATPAAQSATTPSATELKGKSDRENSIMDAAELAATADKLRDELKKIDVNVLPLASIQKTQSMEKLAKKIKGESGVAH